MKSFAVKAVLPAVIALMAFAMPVPAWPASWTGVVKSDSGKRARVVATVDARGALLHFGPPSSCAISAELLEVDNDTAIYRFEVPQNGGAFCDRLYPGDLVVTPVSEDSLHVSFRRQLVPWSGLLERGND
jgi:hypothetical protein